eukprot:6846449-Karenia_brevis.AAC.1
MTVAENIDPVMLNRARMRDQTRQAYDCLWWFAFKVTPNDKLFSKFKDLNLQTCIMQHASRDYPARGKSIEQIIKAVSEETLVYISTYNKHC